MHSDSILGDAKSDNAAESSRMFREAAEAPSAVRRQLRANQEGLRRLGQTLRQRKPRAVLTIARGSSDHAATFAKYLIETRLGVMTASGAPSVSSIYAAPQALGDAVCLAISQSGQSPDLLSAVEAAKVSGALVVALVNDEASPLAALADQVVPLHAGPERSVAATKTYICALSAIAQLVAEWAGDETLTGALSGLPDQLSDAWGLDWRPAVDCLIGAHNLYVVGRGLGLAVAQEAALKFKETCGLHAEALSAAELRHGPMALVGEGFPVMVFSQDDESRASVDALATEIGARGAAVMLAGGAPSGKPNVLNLPSVEAHPALEPLLLIQSFYRLVNHLSVARGFDPDRPPHLNKVTETL